MKSPSWCLFSLCSSVDLFAESVYDLIQSPLTVMLLLPGKGREVLHGDRREQSNERAKNRCSLLPVMILHC